MALRSIRAVTVGLFTLGAIALGCGGESFEGDGGNGGSAGSAGSGASGGTAGGGGSAGSAGGGGSSGSGGSGGSGGGCALTCELIPEACECKRPDVECSDDDDCVVATNHAQCCVDCGNAYPKDIVEQEKCIVPRFREVPPGCTPGHEVCGDVACVAGCALVVRAACEGGKCVPKDQCLPGQVMAGESCVPQCKDAGECELATRVGGCCPGCPGGYHKEQINREPCLVRDGEKAPDECQPDPDACALVDCPAIGCPDPGSLLLTCNTDGMCMADYY